MTGNPLGTRPPEVGTGGRVMRERTRAPFFQRVLKLVSRGPPGGLLVNAIFSPLLDQRRAIQRPQTPAARHASVRTVEPDRQEDGRVGKEGVCTGRTRGS